MTFELLPLLDIMIDFYQQPLDIKRFDVYLKLLKGHTKGDMVLPIGGYNPMAKNHVLAQLMALKNLDAEKVLTETIEEVNRKTKTDKNAQKMRVSISLSDDYGGGWTHKFTTDYDSKFKINALFKRNFCPIVFWSSEIHSSEIIRQRALEYMYRSIYWATNPKPKTLEEHLSQEFFVAQHSKNGFQLSASLMDFYQQNQHSENYQLIFNFLYGDEASKSLNFAIDDATNTRMID
jgi:hypothetical protein